MFKENNNNTQSSGNKPVQQNLGLVPLSQIASVLHIITNPLNPRTDPIYGENSVTFVGGKSHKVPGYTKYELDDGTEVGIHILPNLPVTIKFPDGRTVHISQERIS